MKFDIISQAKNIREARSLWVQSLASDYVSHIQQFPLVVCVIQIGIKLSMVTALNQIFDPAKQYRYVGHKSDSTTNGNTPFQGLPLVRSRHIRFTREKIVQMASSSWYRLGLEIPKIIVF